MSAVPNYHPQEHFIRVIIAAVISARCKKLGLIYSRAFQDRVVWSAPIENRERLIDHIETAFKNYELAAGRDVP